MKVIEARNRLCHTIILLENYFKLEQRGNLIFFSLLQDSLAYTSRRSKEIDTDLCVKRT